MKMSLNMGVVTMLTANPASKILPAGSSLCNSDESQRQAFTK